MANDWIALIEASYDLDGSDEQWLERLLDCIACSFCSEVPHGIAGCRSIPDGARLPQLVSQAVPQLATLIPTSCCARPMDTPADAPRCEARHCKLIGMRFSELSSATSRERLRWSRVASQIGAGWQLRRSAQSLLFESPLARSHSPRQLLRDAALRSIGASQVRATASAAHWDALLAGRWTLVDRFESDGRHLIVAARNDPRFRDPRRLSPRERQIADCVGLGHSLKDIAFRQGLSLSAVSTRVLTVQRKLGLGSLVEVAVFFSVTGVRARLTEIAVRGETLLVGDYPHMVGDVAARLSEAERQVVALLTTGSTNADIARCRGSSTRTVANQVQSIFRKLGARSRAELMIRLQIRR